jgi:hypothetical protein
MACPRRNIESARSEAASLSAVPAENAPAEPARQSPWVGVRLQYQPGSLITPQTEAISCAHDVTDAESTHEIICGGSSPLSAQLEHRLTGLVAELRRLKADSMLVVVKPDTRSELHLDLKLQDGRVKIDVRIQRGDVAGLSAHWAQLQENLAGQGIRLGSLPHVSSSNPAGPDWTGGSAQPQSQQHRPSTLPDVPEPGSQRGPAPSGVGRGKARPAILAGGRSWESWA